MYNAKHTPAPWHHSPETSRPTNELVYAADKHLIARCGAFKRSDEENLANALLIAAAPRLLAALKALIPEDISEHLRDFAPEWLEAAKAIAQAEGEA